MGYTVKNTKEDDLTFKDVGTLIPFRYITDKDNVYVKPTTSKDLIVNSNQVLTLNLCTLALDILILDIFKDRRVELVDVTVTMSK